MRKTLFAKRHSPAATGRVMNRRTFIGGALALCSSVFGARVAAAGDDPGVWTYHGDTGPKHWAEIDPANRLCVTGSRQSPVDLKASTPGEIEPLSLRWMKSSAQLVNNGYTIEVDLPKGSTLSRGGKIYDLIRLDLHAPSEHLVDGKQYPMEIQFVHKCTESDDLAIVSVFLLQGRPNDAFSELSKKFPRHTEKKGELANFSPSDLLPPRLGYWTYEGSITTPPCTENVTWLIIEEPTMVDARDIDNFMSIYVGNARPVVPAKRRKILSFS